MAQPATNPKIEELRFRLKTDPKNRIFYPLAEELRKVGQFSEAEQVLRTGLTNHPTYLSAWVSLGRVLRELKNDGAAVEALNKALQLDPGNVVAARLLADAYLHMGQKVEAIKKYKLVQALLPADEEVEATIERLDRELNPPAPAAIPVETAPGEEMPFAPEPAASVPPAEPEESPFAPETEAAPFAAPVQEAPAAETAPPAEPEAPFAPPAQVFGDETATFPPGRRMPPSIQRIQQEAEAAEEPRSAAAAEPSSDVLSGPWATDESQVFADAAQSIQEEQQTEHVTGDSEPMAAAHAESPFEEPAAYTAAAFEIESPAGMHVAPAPLGAELPVELPVTELAPPEPAASAPLFTAPTEEADVFAPASEALASETREELLPPTEPEDFTNTLTMADLYARQGLVADARQIYENILLRDPENAIVREKLNSLAAAPAASTQVNPPSGTEHDDKRVAKLENWLSRVGKREAGSV